MRQIRPQPSPAVNKARAELIRQITGRIKSAFAKGYYLEAITMEESLISDRLESLASTFRLKPVYLTTLNRNLDPRIQSVLDEKDLVEALNNWWNLRNLSLHEIAKIANRDDQDFDQLFEKRMESSKRIANDGLKLFRDVDAVVRKCTKRQLDWSKKLTSEASKRSRRGGSKASKITR